MKKEQPLPSYFPLCSRGAGVQGYRGDQRKFRISQSSVPSTSNQANFQKKTEREGFEPSDGSYDSINRLAICRFRPLSHLSKVTVINSSTLSTDNPENFQLILSHLRISPSPLNTCPSATCQNLMSMVESLLGKFEYLRS